MSIMKTLAVLSALLFITPSSGWVFGGKTCDSALDEYCADDNDVVCAACSAEDVEEEAKCAKYFDTSEGICSSTADPLLCHMQNTDPCTEDVDGVLCDTTLGFIYGCYKKVCWSQCVDKFYGEDEWCYLATRELGPREDYECVSDDECAPSNMTSVMCSGKCGKSGTFKK